MRRVLDPVIPAVSLVAVVAAILALAEPLVKFGVEGLFSMVGF